MKPSGPYKQRSRRPAPQTPDERAAAMHRYAVQLFDKGDGRAVDWPMVAAMMFKVGLACLDEAKGTERARDVLRRLEAHVYDRQAGNNPEDGTPYTSEPLPRPRAGPSPEMVPGYDLNN